MAEVEKRPRLEHEAQTKFDLALRAETVDSRCRSLLGKLRYPLSSGR